MNEILFEKTTAFSAGYTIPEGAAVRAPEGCSVTMTVNGEVTATRPGAYEGDVVFTVTQAVPRLGKTALPSHANRGEDAMVSYEHEYKAALFVDTDEAGQTRVQAEKSVTGALCGCEYDDKGIRGGRIVNREDYFNGILIADGNYRIDDLEIVYDANGGDDFELYGAAIAVGGNADVVIDNVRIDTHGSIATTVAAAEKCRVLIENSVLKAAGRDERAYRDNCMTEVPWVLGLKGTVRASNVLGAADTTFYNVRAESDGWGVYSTDDAHDCRHRFVNSSARIAKEGPYASGYGNYVLGGSNSDFFGVDYDIATYGLIITGAGKEDLHIGPSSRANLEAYIGKDSPLAAETHGFADIPEKNSVIRAGRSAIMWHGDEGGDNTVVIEPGTRLVTGGPTFLVKAQGRKFPDGRETIGVHPKLDVRGAVIENEGVLLHYMQGDDAGMGDFGFDKHWAEFYEVPEIVPEKLPGHDVTDPDAGGTLRASLHEMDVSGDVYNTVYATPQNLLLTLDRVNYSGAVTTGVQYHRNFKPGERIYIKDALEIGNVGVTPRGGLSNGLLVKLENGSVWTVTGESHITSLTVSEDSAVRAPAGKTLTMMVNGEVIAPAPGTWRGEICLTAE